MGRLARALFRRGLSRSDRAAIAFLLAHKPTSWQEKAQELAVRGDVDARVVFEDAGWEGETSDD